MQTAPDNQQPPSAQAYDEYIRITEFLSDRPFHDELFCGVENIAATVLQLASQRQDAGNVKHLIPDNPMNDPEIIEELDMMPMDYAEVNHNDAKFEADDRLDSIMHRLTSSRKNWMRSHPSSPQKKL